MRILIIDDDLEYADFLQQTLLNIDVSYDIDMSYSSFDALEKLRKTTYDIVIVEIYLQGGLQGNQIIESIKNKSTFKIGMAQELESPMIRQPFNHFIIKPADEKQIQEAITIANYNIKFNF